MDALRRWDSYLTARGLSERTREQYRYYVLRFLAGTMLEPSEVSEDDVAGFLAQIDSRGATRRMFVEALKSYFSWAMRRGLCEGNPAEAFPSTQHEKDPPPGPTLDQAAAVVAAAADHDPRRAWAILLLLETGARISSLADVRPEDTGTQAGEHIHFRTAKGDRPYSVPLSPVAADAVRALLPQANGTLLRVRKRTIWSWVNEAAQASGVNVHPHLFRHRFAENLLERGVDVRTVQRLMNHQKLTTTARYLSVSDRATREAMAVPSFG